MAGVLYTRRRAGEMHCHLATLVRGESAPQKGIELVRFGAFLAFFFRRFCENLVGSRFIHVSLEQTKDSAMFFQVTLTQNGGQPLKRSTPKTAPWPDVGTTQGPYRNRMPLFILYLL